MDASKEVICKYLKRRFPKKKETLEPKKPKKPKLKRRLTVDLFRAKPL